MLRHVSTLTKAQTRKFYSQELFDDYTFLKSHLRIIILVIGVFELARSFLFQSQGTVAKLPTYQNMIIYATSTIGCLCFIISTFQFMEKRFFKKYHLRYILVIVANIGISSSVFVRAIWELQAVIRVNNLESWLDAFTLLTTLTFGIVLADVIFPNWAMKIMLPMSMFIGVFIVVLQQSPSNLFVLVFRMITSSLYIIALSMIKDKFRWKIFLKRLDDETWKELQMKILGEIPTSIAIMDIKDEKIIYTNAEFKKWAGTTPPEEFLKRIVNLTQRKERDDLFRSAESEFVVDMSPRSMALEIQPSTNRRPTNDDGITENMVTPKPLLQKGSTSSLYNVVKEFCLNYKNSNEKDPCLEVYDGVFAKTKDIHLSFEIKLSCIEQHPKVIIMLNDTTQRDIIVSLKSNNKYKDNLLASISHELRTPLNGSLSLLQTAIDQESEDSVIRKQFLEPALKSGRLLVHIINDILDYSQLSSNSIKLALQDLSILQTIKECYELTELQAKKKGLEFLMIVQGVIPTSFVTDHSRVKQILLNLLSNAIKFTFKGKIQVGIEATDPDTIRISVTDTGIGMRHEERKKMFNTYFTFFVGEKITENSTGVGLGLTVANKLARLLGPVEGQGLVIESEYSKGSTFAFYIQNKARRIDSMYMETNEVSRELMRIDNVITSFDEFPNEASSPAIVLGNGSKYLFSVQSKENIATRSVAAKISAVKKSKRLLKMSKYLGEAQQEEGYDILIVDDDPFNVVALEALLKPYKLRIDVAYNGQDALDKVTGQSQQANDLVPNYRLILMDFNMPIMNGYDTTKRLIELMNAGCIARLSIVGCTAYNTKQDIDRGIRCGMSEVITKPVAPAILSSILKRYL